VEPCTFPEGLRALVIEGLSGCESDESVKFTVDSFFASLAHECSKDVTQSGAVELLSRDRSVGRFALELRGAYARYSVTEKLCKSLISDIGAVRF
jgi:hypothetical protein